MFAIFDLIHRPRRADGKARPRPSTLYMLVVASCGALVIAGVAVGIVFSAKFFVHRHDTCENQGATRVLHEGGNRECVGITDGAYVFDPSLASIESDIRAEDHRVTSAHPGDYVSIVMLLPISSTNGSILSLNNAVEQLRGAYVAQYYANRHDVDGVAPYIKLLIGSNGYQANEWQPTARIIEHAASGQHIVAVAGLGVSLTTTQEAAHALTAAGLPVIGATLTSDNFDNIRNFIRVSPSNKDEISVAVSYIRSRFGRADLIEDENHDDTYDSTLVDTFQTFAGSGHTIVGRETYNTVYRDTATSRRAADEAELAVANRISQMPTDICAAQPSAVLFAGRGRDLASLVGDLGDRPCLNKPITIFSGDDVTNMPYSDAVRQGLASGVTVDYVGVANPGEWDTGRGAAVAEGRQGFATFRTAFDGRFSGAPLTDGNSMMAYDAALTAISAIRLTSQPKPAPFAVAGELGALQGARTVPGSSGPLAFTADYDTSRVGSNPVGKAIPILRLALDGTSEFVALEWPNGEPKAY